MEHMNLESQLYRIYELETELLRGREQYSKAIPQYEALIDIVDKSGRIEELPDNFIDSTKDDLANITKGLHNIEQRLAYINILREKIEQNPEAEQILTLTMYALGLSDVTVEDAE